MNSWVIVRWALVVVIYAATVLIAIDQVRDKERALDDAERMFDEQLSAANHAAKIKLDDYSTKSHLRDQMAKDKISVLEDQVKVLDGLLKASNSDKISRAKEILEKALGN